MPAKKSPAKKPTVKKVIKKRTIKIEPAKPEMTDHEHKVLVQVQLLLDDGYELMAVFEDRRISLKKAEDIIEYMKTYTYMEVLGSSIGKPAKSISLR